MRRERPGPRLAPTRTSTRRSSIVARSVRSSTRRSLGRRLGCSRVWSSSSSRRRKTQARAPGCRSPLTPT
eukprot:4040738-Pleurochrysis_carterae.AAC.1